MRNKTFWQWLAFVCFWVGLAINIINQFTPIIPNKYWWILMLLVFSLWSVSIACVIFKPVRKS